MTEALPQPPTLETLMLCILACFWLGCCVGSFINVVVHRLPIMNQQPSGPNDNLSNDNLRNYNLALPPSHCPSCGEVIKVWQNVPIFSYLWLNGRARCCGSPIHARYFIVEVVTGMFSALLCLSLLTKLPWPLLQPLQLMPLLLELLEHLIVLWLLTALIAVIWSSPTTTAILWQALLWLGLLWNLNDFYQPLAQAIIGVCCTYAAFNLTFILWRNGSGLAAAANKKTDAQHVHLLAHSCAAVCAWFPIDSVYLLGVGSLLLAAGSATVIRLFRPGGMTPRQSDWPLRAQWAIVATFIIAWLANFALRG